ncbi:MAG: hypothetical protein IJK84_02035 [Bacteroidales bacterium]|nr:hypothetical protein [Bacteroidales bacterium]
MAQLNGIPLITKGRIGDYSIYLRDNKLIVRSRYNESHGRRQLSERQLRQCTRMGNAVALWRAFPEEYRPAFQHRRSGVSNYNMFVTHAMQAHPIYLSRPMTQRNACVVSDVMVSQGSLTEIVVEHDGTAPTTNIWLGGLTIGNGTTIRQLAKAIVDNNLDYRPGDHLLYYRCEQQWSQPIDMPVVKICCQRVVLDLADDRTVNEVVGDSIGFAQRGGLLAAVQEVEGGMAWVHTRNSEETLLLSTQRLVCNNPLIANYGSDEAYEAACDSYRRTVARTGI